MLLEMSCLQSNPYGKSTIFIQSPNSDILNSIPTVTETNTIQTFGERLRGISDEGSHNIIYIQGGGTTEGGYFGQLNDRVSNYQSDSPILFILFHLNNTNHFDDLSQLLIQFRLTRKMTSFLCVYLDPSAQITSLQISTLYEKGVSMVSQNISDIVKIIAKMKDSMYNNGRFSCPICKKGGIAHHLDRNQIKEHISLFHAMETNDNISIKIPRCPICKQTPQKIRHHLKVDHASEDEPSDNDLLLTTIYPFCLVVCKRKKDGKFLLVNELCGMGWWLPGGKAHYNESFQATAIREVKEEAGIDIDIKGILRMEFSPNPKYGRLRVIFYAEPVDEEQLPKSIPDSESCGAAWVSSAELDHIHLRGKEPRIWFKYLEKGGAIFPPSILTPENAQVSIKQSFNVIPGNSSSSSSPSTSAGTSPNSQRYKQIHENIHTNTKSLDGSGVGGASMEIDDSHMKLETSVTKTPPKVKFADN